MFDDRELTAKDIKKILMLYGNMQRLEVLNKKIQNNQMDSVKKRVLAIKQIQDGKKRNAELEGCLLEIIGIWDETRNNIVLYNSTISNILTAYDKIILADRDKKQRDELDGGCNGLE